MTTTLVTGATRGLGRETARQLVAAGHTVYVAAALAAIEADGGLDVLG
jgi:NAD(P)-dependent dehydrogenase (short-subunit alcohol dehydrogenase family)